MGTAHQFLCGDCGHRFTASEDFSFGFLGEVVTPVVCAVHSINEAEVGVNVARGGEITPTIQARPTFPCGVCGKASPRWDGTSCPECGKRNLLPDGMILWD